MSTSKFQPFHRGKIKIKKEVVPMGIKVNKRKAKNHVSPAKWNQLIEDKFPVGYISGDRSVSDRNEIMENFKNGSLRILLSTDLLSRGIDIQQLSLVINYDLPKEKEVYIHRIGRSGRYGRKGVAINLITEREVEDLKYIESFYDTKINEMPENIGDYLN